MRLLSVITALMLLPVFSLGQMNVRKAGEGFSPGDKKGLFYYLPRKGIRLEITAEKIMKLQGPYANYAEEYLGIHDHIQSNSTTWCIKSIGLKVFDLPDPRQLYFASYDEKQSKGEGSLLLSLTRAGVLVGSELIRDPGGETGLKMTGQEEERKGVSEYFRYAADNNRYEDIDTVIRKISIDTLTIKDISFRTSMQAKSPEQKAAEAVEWIDILRENQHNLLIGYQEVPYSRETIEFMYEKLQEMENEYLDLFRGKVITSTTVHFFTFIPEAGDADRSIPLFRFSEEKGITGLGESSGEPVHIKFLTLGKGKPLEDAVPDASGVGEEKEGQGFFYRVPEYTMISIRYADEFRDAMSVYMPQFGTVINLPSIFKTSVFYPEEGSLKSTVIRF